MSSPSNLNLDTVLNPHVDPPHTKKRHDLSPASLVKEPKLKKLATKVEDKANHKMKDEERHRFGSVKEQQRIQLSSPGPSKADPNEVTFIGSKTVDGKRVKKE